MANEDKKDFNAMLYKKTDMPKIQIVTDAATIKKYGGERMYFAPPAAYDEVMKKVPAGKVITVGEIRDYFARNNGADFTDPITAGIFVSIAAWASWQRKSLVPGQVRIFLSPKSNMTHICRVSWCMMNKKAGKEVVEMLTWENMTALRMRRQCLTAHADYGEYDRLYRDLSPGLNLHWHGFGQPPCLVYRTDFDDVAYNGERQLSRILVKGRFVKGNIGFIEADQMELYACAYRKPYRPTDYSDLLLALIGREGPMNIGVIKEMTGLLVKQITPSLHRLQEAFLLFEDQNDGEWDRGWYLFKEMFPDVNTERYTRPEAFKHLLKGLFYRFVHLTAEEAGFFYGISRREIGAILEDMVKEGFLARWEAGYIRTEDMALLKSRAFESMRGVLALHRNDPLVRYQEWRLKKRYKGAVKGSEVMQYLLIDGEIRGAVMGHFRYGPYDLHEIRTELPPEELRERREEIMAAVKEVNGERDYELPILPPEGMTDFERLS